MGSEAKGSRPDAPVALLVCVAVLIAVGAGGYFLLQRSRQRPVEAPVLTQEAASYLSSLQLSEVEMKASESYLRQTVTNLSGKIANRGSRIVRLAEVHCVFRDPYGQVVLREKVALVGPKTGPAAPGDARSFLVAFDNIPESWNRAVPDLVIAQILFQD